MIAGYCYSSWEAAPDCLRRTTHRQPGARLFQDFRELGDLSPRAPVAAMIAAVAADRILDSETIGTALPQGTQYG